jgi:protein-disulfide isomerase
MTKTRREMLELMGAAGAIVAAAKFGLVSPALAQGAGDVPVAQLMAEGALPDIWIGSKDAPVTIIEYASMTCPHCAHFANEVFPSLKKTYLDTGKARFTLREFPFDPLATAAFMLARCQGDDKREAVVDLLFAQQQNWAFKDKPLEGLVASMRQTGMSQQAFEACLKDKALYDKVNAVRDRAAKDFKVDSTPTFFINGKRVNGSLSPAEFAKIIDPMLKS